jgi:site-specific DNA-methyltransferase (adenine-specific)
MQKSLFENIQLNEAPKPPLQQCSVSRSTLYLGDCFDAFKYVDDESIDAIIADLPYGTTACKWDSVLPFDKLWCEYERIIKPNGAIVLTASQPFTSALVMSNPKLFKYQWVWVKTKKTGFTNGKNRPLSQHEDVLVFSKANVANGSKIMMKYNPQGLQPLGKVRKGDKNKSVGDTNGQKYYRPSQSKDYIQEFTNYPTTILNVASEGKIMHPTQKPVELMEYLIRTYTDENDTVLDNTMGSGTTGLACLKTNRQFIGIEKEKKYYDVAVRRLSEYCG